MELFLFSSYGRRCKPPPEPNVASVPPNLETQPPESQSASTAETSHPECPSTQHQAELDFKIRVKVLSDEITQLHELLKKREEKKSGTSEKIRREEKVTSFKSAEGQSDRLYGALLHGSGP